MILIVKENTFDFIRIDGGVNDQIMRFRFRRLKSDGYVNDLDKITGIECVGSFKVNFDKYEWYINSIGESFMIVLEVPYSSLAFEYIDCDYISTRLGRTDGQPVIFNQFINNTNVKCVTFNKDMVKPLYFNNIEYTPELGEIRNDIEIEVDGDVVDLTKYDLSVVDQIILVHMHTTNISIIGLPDSFIESDKYDMELAISLRNNLNDKDRIQFRVGLTGDDPCITKFVRLDK